MREPQGKHAGDALHVQKGIHAWIINMMDRTVAIAQPQAEEFPYFHTNCASSDALIEAAYATCEKPF